MTWKAEMNDDKKQHLRDYHKQYKNKYFKASNSMKKSKALYDLKRKYVIPDETLATFGNNIPYLLKLQMLLELISPEVLHKYLSLETKFEFTPKP